MLILAGLLVMVVGVFLMVFTRVKIPFLGRLPGDILLQNKNFVFYFPLASSILVSVVMTFIFYLISRK